jgi:hypothetical protein
MLSPCLGMPQPFAPPDSAGASGPGRLGLHLVHWLLALVALAWQLRGYAEDSPADVGSGDGRLTFPSQRGSLAHPSAASAAI